MSARQKLNTAYALGSVAIAALIGTLFQSWLVFGLAALLLVALSFVNGAIRPHKRNR